VLRWFIGILGVSAVSVVPVAHANPDDQFLAATSAAGIAGDPAQLIGFGHAACDNYGHVGMVGLMYQIEGAGLSKAQASAVFTADWQAYCPEKTAGLPPGA
jgi:hypothetical protein